MSMPISCATLKCGYSARKWSAMSGLASFSTNATTISAVPAATLSRSTARA